MKHIRLWRIVDDCEGEAFDAIGCCLTFLYQFNDNGKIVTIQVGGHVGECAYVSFADASTTQRDAFKKELADLMKAYGIVEAGYSVIDNVQPQHMLRLSGDNVSDFEFCSRLDELF